MKEPPHAAFAARLRSARVRVGKSQEAIAAEVGTSRRHWIRWERGEHLPSPLFIGRIAEATGKPAEFFTGAPAATSTTDDDEESHQMTLDEFLRFRIDALISERERVAS